MWINLHQTSTNQTNHNPPKREGQTLPNHQKMSILYKHPHHQPVSSGECKGYIYPFCQTSGLPISHLGPSPPAAYVLGPFQPLTNQAHQIQPKPNLGCVSKPCQGPFPRGYRQENTPRLSSSALHCHHMCHVPSRLPSRIPCHPYTILSPLGTQHVPLVSDVPYYFAGPLHAFTLFQTSWNKQKLHKLLHQCPGTREAPGGPEKIWDWAPGSLHQREPALSDLAAAPSGSSTNADVAKATLLGITLC